jgi:hypothetical protein
MTADRIGGDIGRSNTTVTRWRSAEAQRSIRSTSPSIARLRFFHQPSGRVPITFIASTIHRTCPTVRACLRALAAYDHFPAAAAPRCPTKRITEHASEKNRVTANGAGTLRLGCSPRCAPDTSRRNDAMNSRTVAAFITVLVAAASACGKPTGTASSSSSPAPANPAATAAPAPAKALPRTFTEVCDGLTWPRPMPPMVGLILDGQTELGEWGSPTACLTNVRGIAPDRSVVWENGFYKPNIPPRLDRIVAVSPPPGTPVGRHDSVTVNLVPVDLNEPPAYHPCDWVGTAEAAGIIGAPSVTTGGGGRELQNLMGSTDMWCDYQSADHHSGLVSELLLRVGHIVDAASEFAMWAAQDDSTAVDGVGINATCATVPKNRDTNRLFVLLPGERVYVVTGWSGGPCDSLRQFAQTAIPRIGA